MKRSAPREGQKLHSAPKSLGNIFMDTTSPAAIL